MPLGKRKITSYLTTVAKSMLLPLVLTMEKMRFKEGSTSCTFQSSSKSPKFINIRTVVLGQTKDLLIQYLSFRCILTMFVERV